MAVTIPAPRGGLVHLSQIGNELALTTSLDQTITDLVLKVLMPTNTEVQQKE